MASGDTTTNQTTQTSGPTDPNVQATTSLLAQKFGGLAAQSPAAYGKSLYAGVSPTTTNAWAQGSGVASGLINSGGLNSAQTGALSNVQGLAGAYDQNAPGYQAMRDQSLNDAITGVTAGQLGSGLLGSRSYIQDATKAATNAIAPLDYQNFQNNINNRYHSAEDAFSMGQQGIGNQNAALSSLGAIGAGQDADLASQRQGEYDLYTRQQQAPLQWLQGVTSAAAGNAATSPQAQTSSTQVPWWQAILGAGATAGGIYGSLTRPF